MAQRSYLVNPGTSAEALAEQRQSALAALRGASDTSPKGHWLQALAQTLQGGLAGYELGEMGNVEKGRQDEASDLYRQAFDLYTGGASGGSGGAGGAAGSAAGAAAVAPGPASPAMAAAAAAGREGGMPMSLDEIANRTIGAESGGDPNAKNPRSSATGSGQFIDSTWLSMMKKSMPTLTQGKSDAQLLAMRTDPNISREMTKAYAQENQAALRASGMEVTPGTTYLAHFLGPGGARSVLSTRDNVPVAEVLPAGVIQANPFLARMTTGQVKSWADSKMAREARVSQRFGGGAAPAAAAQLVGAPGNPRAQMAGDLYRNEITRPLAQQMLTTEMGKQGKKPEVVTIELGNGQKRSMLQMGDGSLKPIPSDMMGGAGGGPLPPNFEDTMKLRKEVADQPNVKKFGGSIGVYNSMIKSAATPTRAADLDMVNAFAKIMDPDSAIREGEFAVVAAAQSIPDRIKGQIQYFMEGQGNLTPEARQKLIEVAGNRVGSYRDLATKDTERFTRLAKRFGMDESLIVPEFEPLGTWTPPAEQSQQQAPRPVIRWEDGPDGKPRRVQ